mmetsp:Transcript_44020/g.135875  ORF Transcript_44020/g.135875 Transcript_44020/m.135875 type:complete len:284 (-) Transcript_44020:153-1004(-)
MHTTAKSRASLLRKEASRSVRVSQDHIIAHLNSRIIPRVRPQRIHEQAHDCSDCDSSWKEKVSLGNLVRRPCTRGFCCSSGGMYSSGGLHERPWRPPSLHCLPMPLKPAGSNAWRLRSSVVSERRCTILRGGGGASFARALFMTGLIGSATIRSTRVGAASIFFAATCFFSSSAQMRWSSSSVTPGRMRGLGRGEMTGGPKMSLSGRWCGLRVFAPPPTSRPWTKRSTPPSPGLALRFISAMLRSMTWSRDGTSFTGGTSTGPPTFLPARRCGDWWRALSRTK